MILIKNLSICARLLVKRYQHIDQITHEVVLADTKPSFVVATGFQYAECAYTTPAVISYQLEVEHAHSSSLLQESNTETLSVC